jgi:hypothetical protein
MRSNVAVWRSAHPCAPEVDVVVPVTGCEDVPVDYVPSAQTRMRCGRNLDWIEAPAP